MINEVGEPRRLVNLEGWDIKSPLLFLKEDSIGSSKFIYFNIVLLITIRCTSEVPS